MKIKRKSLIRGLVLSITFLLVFSFSAISMPVSAADGLIADDTILKTAEGTVNVTPMVLTNDNTDGTGESGESNGGTDAEVIPPNSSTPNSATPPSSANGSITNEVQDGGGTIIENGEETDNLTGKQFVVFETKSGKVFYLIVDHDKSMDNVFLLTEVNENDLLNFVNEADESGVVGSTGNGTANAQQNNNNTNSEQNNTEQPKSTNNTGLIVVIIAVAGIGGAAFYFFKFKKGKGKPQGGEFDFDDEEYGDDPDETPDEDGDPDDGDETETDE